ncbi:MAG TPA: efflux RND transporter periplasmic adaptor subunit [Bacteroidales bacterium]|nr:efflux RND transporter periplasmic adaptor subunit [Bacteroidales bacterium]
MKKQIVFLSLLIIALLTGCRSKTTIPVKTEENIRVKTVVATAGEISPVNEYSGTVKAFREANVGATLPGKVEKYYYREGDFVKKGALLAEMSGELYTQAEAERIAISKDFERVQRLLEKGSVTQQEYDHIKALHDAAVEKAEMLRKNTRITAPFDGIVAEYLVKEGENYFFSLPLEPGYSMTSGIVKLIQTDQIKVVFEVNERDLCFVKPGTKVSFVCPALADTFHARVSSIKPIISTITRSATVEAVCPNRNFTILPGMSAHVFINLPAVKGTILPVNAIYNRQGSSVESVFVIRDNKAHEIKVERFASRNGLTVVREIEPGSMVALTSKDKLYENCPVTLVDR